MFDGAHSARRPNGQFIVDGKVVADTLRCCHCSSHFVFKAGSGKERGWCTLCGAVTCGKAECKPCVPFERQLERLEKSGRVSSRW